jgi:hypothetical protein
MEKLVQWANDVDHNGNSNYGQFVKLFTKLVPPPAKDGRSLDDHESFIKMIMEEEKKRIEGLGKPAQVVLDVPSVDQHPGQEGELGQ